MTVAPQLWILGIGLGVVGAAVAVGRVLERKRREAYQEYCLAKGYRFEGGRPGAEQHYADTLDLFTKGRAQAWGYTITGSFNGFPFTAFEYRWTTGSGKSSQTHRIAPMLWEAPGASFPKFCLTPEGFWTRVGELFGMQDIDFADSPEFSKAYRLKGDDEQAVRAFFSPDRRSFLAMRPGQHVAGKGSEFLWWRNGRLPKIEELLPFFEEGDRVRRAFIKD